MEIENSTPDTVDKPLVSILAQKIADTFTAEIPKEVLFLARLRLADFIACHVAGTRQGVFPPILNAYLQSQESNAECTIPGIKSWKTNCMNAALSMGSSAHAVELDDGHRFGTAHPAVAVIPAALAVCERERETGQKLFQSIVLGYEIMLRMAVASNPSHLFRGFHTTGTCGVFGAAVSAALLQGLDRKGIQHTLSIAGLQSSGLQEMLHDNPAIKPLQAGQAASNGVLAADLASRGAQGPATLIEGFHGWRKAYTDTFDSEHLVSGWGESFEIERTYIKLYPTCRHCHVAIDLALEARNAVLGQSGLISLIEITTYSVALSEVGQIFHPKTVDEAMFSLPFAIALALRDGKVSLDAFCAENFGDPGLAQLAGTVKIKLDPEMDRKYPRERGARMRIFIKESPIWDLSAPLPKGEPEISCSEESLFQKFSLCLEGDYSRPRIEALWQHCLSGKEDATFQTELYELLNSKTRQEE